MQGLRALFQLVKAIGIGLVQKSFMAIMFNETPLLITRQIKAFDPNNIFNAGKIFD